LFGVVHFAWDEFEVHPVNLTDATDPDGAVSITRTPRPTGVPDVGGDLTVASFNVLNYFVTLDSGPDGCGPTGALDCRGADSQAEFDIQSAKIATAVATLDADIVGLVELENSGTDAAVADLVAKVNAISARTYDYISTGFIGTDAIAVGLMYDTATVAPAGGFATLTSADSPAYIDTKNRPALAQTFTDLATGQTMTIAVNHLKSKGSACDDVANPGDPAFGVAPYALGDDLDVGPIGDPAFTGNCNLTRTAAAQVLGGWLAADPTGTPSDNLLILGDLNAYVTETPITALEALGFVDLQRQFGASPSWADGGHSFVFDGEHGTLDYAMANPAMAGQTTGAAAWHINADEPFAIDYQNFNPPGQVTLDEWKSSDHDPILIGLSLAAPGPTCNGLPATMVGTDRGERIFGTPGDDVIVALGGNDTVFGRGGNDTICLGDGDDKAFGGVGDDTIFGENGKDRLSGQAGDDTLDGGDGRDDISGGTGDDVIDGGPENDKLYGYSDDDVISGGGGNDFLSGGSGDDDLDGGEDDDRMNGGSGDDDMAGGPGKDRMFGNNGIDEMSGGDDADLVDGGSGDDDLAGDAGDDDLRGRAGNDDLDGGADIDKANGHGGTDTCSNAETVISCEL
ncbi:MAG: ExeM/NucH family extracellular endonuclease, partial [Actinomycetota bacterium]